MKTLLGTITPYDVERKEAMHGLTNYILVEKYPQFMINNIQNANKNTNDHIQWCVYHYCMGNKTLSGYDVISTYDSIMSCLFGVGNNQLRVSALKYDMRFTENLKNSECLYDGLDYDNLKHRHPVSSHFSTNYPKRSISIRCLRAFVNELVKERFGNIVGDIIRPMYGSGFHIKLDKVREIFDTVTTHIVDSMIDEYGDFMIVTPLSIAYPNNSLSINSHLFLLIVSNVEILKQISTKTLLDDIDYHSIDSGLINKHVDKNLNLLYTEILKHVKGKRRWL